MALTEHSKTLVSPAALKFPLSSHIKANPLARPFSVNPGEHIGVQMSPVLANDEHDS
jgi:hypothetical protein